MTGNVEDRYNEYRLIFGLFTGYGFYSLLRKSFSVSVPFMRVSLRLSKADVGNIATSFSVAYGVSKFVGGVVSDFFPPASLFAIGLFLAALSNLLFSFSSNTSMLCILWFLNGTFQGFGWPALSQIVTNKIDPKRAGTVWSILVSAGNIGYLLGPFFLLPLTKYGWEIPFRVSGSVGMCFACVVYIILTSSKSLTKFNLEKYINDIDKQNDNEGIKIINNKIYSDVKTSKIKQDTIKEENLSTLNEMKNDEETVTNELDQEFDKSKILLECFFSLNLWLLMLVGGITTFVLKSMADWTGLFLVEHCGFSTVESTELMLWNEIGGMIGTLLCGVLSDFLGGKKYLTLFIFVIICMPAMFYFPSKRITESNSMENANDFNRGILDSYVSITSLNDMLLNIVIFYKLVYITLSGKLGIVRLCLFTMGFGINGPKTLLGVMIRDLVPRGVSGTIGGVFGLVSQVGASVSGAGLGYILEVYGWEKYMVFLLYGIYAITIALIVPVLTLNSTSKISYKQKDE